MGRKIIIFFILMLLLAGLLSPAVLANQSTFYIYSPNQHGMSRTQNAYLPDRNITDFSLNEPQDIFIDIRNELYIADTGNMRVLRYGIETGTVDFVLEHHGFRAPKGLYVTDAGDIYVADSSAATVFRFDRSGELLETFTRPTQPAFADTAFNPAKVAVDNRGGMLIISEGVYNGVIQLSNGGDFLGYFTTNKTTLSLLQVFQDIIYTRTQRERVADRVPTTIANVFIDNEGVVYTTTSGTMVNAMKKHNTAGINMIRSESVSTLHSIWVDGRGIIYTASARGQMHVYTPDGELIYVFSASSDDNDIAGLFDTLSAVAVDNDGHIWGVDSEKGFIQSFRPTEYAENIYSALTLFNEGRYEESKDVWTDILRLNQLSAIAHNGIGKAYIYNHEYDLAMQHFEIAGNREMYSQAYWEVRNQWLQKQIGFYVAAIGITFILLQILLKLDRKKRVRAARDAAGAWIRSIPALHSVLYAFSVSRHPLDCFYEIKKGKSGSIFGASFLYIGLFAAFIYYQVGKGFIFQYQSAVEIDFLSMIIGFFSILFLFILTNYLSSSIQDGKGYVKDIFMVPAYSSLPATLAFITATVMSHVLTQNETVFITFILILGVGWTVINILLGLTEIHDFLFRETLKNVFISFLLMIVVALVLTIFFVMWGQVSQFIIEVAKELWRNLTGWFS